jgi:hypothetical protein
MKMMDQSSPQGQHMSHIYTLSVSRLSLTTLFILALAPVFVRSQQNWSLPQCGGTTPHHTTQHPTSWRILDMIFLLLKGLVTSLSSGASTVTGKNVRSILPAVSGDLLR